MPTATLSPQYVNQPKPGKKKGSIKDGDGRYFYMEPELLRHFERGQETTFDYTETVDKEGNTWLNVKKVHRPENPNNQYPAPAPGPKPQNGVGFRPSMTPKDAQEARISLLCQAYAQAGIVPSAQDVENLVLNVTRGVTLASPKLTSPQRADDMADEIPY